MIDQLATNTNKSPEPPPTDAGALSDSERARQPPLPEPTYKPYKPYAEKPAPHEPPYRPYAERPAPHEPPYEPYKDI